MPSRNGTTQPPLDSNVVIPTVRIPQPDGSVLIRAGKPVILEDMINTREAAALLGMSRNWVIAECQAGRFKTAYKPGLGQKCWWKISRSEVLERKQFAPS